MAIIGWPDDANIAPSVLCITCKSEQPLADVTAGLEHANGQQAFACITHFKDGISYLKGWVRFSAAQHKTQLEQPVSTV